MLMDGHDHDDDDGDDDDDEDDDEDDEDDEDDDEDGQDEQEEEDHDDDDDIGIKNTGRLTRMMIVLMLMTVEVMMTGLFGNQTWLKQVE